MRFTNALAFAAAVLMIGQAALAQESGSDEAATEDSKVMQILKAADEATKNVKAVRYEAESVPTGAIAGREPVVRGKVLKSAQNAPATPIFGKGWFFEPGPNGGRESNFIASFDGSTITRLNPDRKRFWQGSASGGGGQQILGPVINLNMIEFGHPTPFQDEIGGRVQDYEGQTMVHGVLCDVVYVEYDITPAQSARWYFGVEDHLPRRVERLRTVGDRQGARVLSIANLEVDPEIEEGAFTLEVPEDYERGRTPSAGPRPSANPVGIGGGGR